MDFGWPMSVSDGAATLVQVGGLMSSIGAGELSCGGRGITDTLRHIFVSLSKVAQRTTFP